MRVFDWMRLLSARYLGRGSSRGYDYLLEVPRYQDRIVGLLGSPFKIADARSFYWSYREIFIDEIYRFHSASNSPVILDCGSNYGTSVVYFKQLYPDARIVAIEPDPLICEILEWNLTSRGLSDVEVRRAALTNRSGPLTWYHEGADAGRLHRLEGAARRFEVDTTSLDELIGDDVDLLKMDIEGEETEVLCASRRLGHVRQMMVEYHSFCDRDQQLHRLLCKLSDAGFRYYVNTQFVSRRPLVEPSEQFGMDLQLNIFALSARALAAR